MPRPASRSCTSFAESDLISRCCSPAYGEGAGSAASARGAAPSRQSSAAAAVNRVMRFSSVGWGSACLRARPGGAHHRGHAVADQFADFYGVLLKRRHDLRIVGGLREDHALCGLLDRRADLVLVLEQDGYGRAEQVELAPLLEPVLPAGDVRLDGCGHPG